MAMNLANADGDEDEMNADINTTPLVDVMLVLLIIFLIAVPVVTQSVQLDLPKESNLLLTVSTTDQAVAAPASRATKARRAMANAGSISTTSRR